MDGRLNGKPAADVLEHTGWARSVGGVGPYLGLFARAGTSRDEADAAVAGLQIHELPSARGCTYVLPASDFALGLKVGQNFGDDMPTVRKLGVTDSEIDKLSVAILRALEKGPLEPDELRRTAGAAVRNLGAEGAKKGVTTTLPVALGRLQAAGEIRRVSTNGRLDQQRYRYALWRPDPLSKFKMSSEEGLCRAGAPILLLDWPGHSRGISMVLGAGRQGREIGSTAAKAGGAGAWRPTVASGRTS